MPTYEYQCQKCEAVFECFQSMKDAALTECTKELCPKKKWGKGQVKRLLGSGAGLIFKGSGFYITDYRSEGYKTAAKSDKPAPAAPAAPATPAKTESKKPASSTKKGKTS